MNITKSSLPLVSIVTPSFNAMPYLKATIESVINQNYPNIEHIVMDGGSTDGTVELLKCYPDIIWMSERDNGQSHALNKGFQMAKGEIIGWLNADDTYEPEAVISAVRYLLKNEDVDLVGSHVNIIDESEMKIGVSFTESFDILKLLNFNMVKQPTVFMRRRVIDELKGVDEKLHYVMDWDLWLRAGMAGFKYKFLKDIFGANFRLVEGTKSYNQTCNFHLEWQNVLINVFTHSHYGSFTEKIKKRALNNNMSQFYIQKMLESIDSKNRSLMFKYLAKAAKLNFNVLLNIGTWKHIYLGLLSKKRDKNIKFKKNLTAIK